jgi:hypothetical protein
MTDHDQFFKNLFQELFSDLLRIVAPELAGRLRVEAPAFLESELFTSFPEGSHRYLDLVVRVEAREGEPSGCRGVRRPRTWRERSPWPGALPA